MPWKYQFLQMVILLSFQLGSNLLKTVWFLFLGNILCYEDLLECLKQTGCEGIMVAGSLKNLEIHPKRILDLKNWFH